MRRRQRGHVEREGSLWDTEQSRVADLLSESEDRLRRLLDRLNTERATVLRRPAKKGHRDSPST